MTPTKLSDKALLVKLTVRKAALTRRDATLTANLQASEKDTSLTVLTKLFKRKDSAIKDIMTRYNEVYIYHRKHTLPYVDAGPRILPNEMYMEYTQEMRHRIAQVDSLLNTYMPMYDQLVLDDINDRNSGHAAGRATVEEYPSAEEFRASMSAEIRFLPMADASHFLFDLSDEDIAAFRRAEEDAAVAANVDTIQRMLKPLASLVTKLSEYQGAKGERFHNSLIENVVDGCKLARKLALSPSAELLTEITSLEEAAQGFMSEVEIIKGSANKRDEAKRKLEEVAARMGAFA